MILKSKITNQKLNLFYTSLLFLSKEGISESEDIQWSLSPPPLFL